jgi:divalent metal cation (Fe/Co/Zn/Cd) transporter
MRVRTNDLGVFVHYHCRFAPHETVEDVHAAVDRIENGLQAKFPAIRRVIAHAEPIGRARHKL